MFSPAARDGPIYSVEWNPNGTEFCVVYGFMPAKATLYDLKCEAKFDFGTGPRNSSFYNPLGNNILFSQLCIYSYKFTREGRKI
jgi:translation initiation factor 2A